MKLSANEFLNGLKDAGIRIECESALRIRLHNSKRRWPEQLETLVLQGRKFGIVFIDTRPHDAPNRFLDLFSSPSFSPQAGQMFAQNLARCE